MNKLPKANNLFSLFLLISVLGFFSSLVPNIAGIACFQGIENLKKYFFYNVAICAIFWQGNAQLRDHYGLNPPRLVENYVLEASGEKKKKQRYEDYMGGYGKFSKSQNYLLILFIILEAVLLYWIPPL